MNKAESDTDRLAEPIYQSAPTRILVIGTVVCAVVALIAIILAAYAVGKTNTKDSEGAAVNPTNQQGPVLPNNQSKVWTIALGHDWGAHEYVDPQGYLAGFSHDLIQKVCSAAGIRCKTVWEPYNHCWDSQAGQRARGGIGLLGKWYDACTGWVNTVERSAVYSFSYPFLQGDSSYLYVKRGNPKGFTGKDLQNLQQPMGFLDGWSSDEKCLARQDDIKNAKLDKSKILHFLTTTDLKQALNNGTVIAVLAGSVPMGGDAAFEKVGQARTCYLTGNGMMTRKDSDFTTYWNKGFNKIKGTGEYKRVCSDANTKHGSKGQVSCLK